MFSLKKGLDRRTYIASQNLDKAKISIAVIREIGYSSLSHKNRLK